MNKPAAITGTFVALTPVASRKVVRLHIECAIELADNILACLGGYPDPANPKHVAVAQLNGAPQVTLAEPKERQKFSRLRPSAQAALLCDKALFWKFMSENYDDNYTAVRNEDDAVQLVREHCKVTSRAELDRDNEAAQRWIALRDRYDAWVAVGE